MNAFVSFLSIKRETTTTTPRVTFGEVKTDHKKQIEREKETHLKAKPRTEEKRGRSKNRRRKRVLLFKDEGISAVTVVIEALTLRNRVVPPSVHDSAAPPLFLGLQGRWVGWSKDPTPVP